MVRVEDRRLPWFRPGIHEVMRVIGNVAGKDVVGRARWTKLQRMQDLVNHRELPVTGRLAGAGVRVQTRNPGQDSAEVESRPRSLEALAARQRHRRRTCSDPS